MSATTADHRAAAKRITDARKARDRADSAAKAHDDALYEAIRTGRDAGLSWEQLTTLSGLSRARVGQVLQAQASA